MLKQKSDVFGRALAVGAGLQKQEQATSTVLANIRKSSLAVSEILPRQNPASRALNPQHVLDLAESIAALGLIEPVAVDQRNHLLAGGHRWAALRICAAQAEHRPALWSELFGETSPAVPARLQELPSMSSSVAVHVLPIDSALDPGMALALEVAENERRKAYGRDEILGLVETLKAAGYRHVVGRPRFGQRAIIPALTAVLGKSRRTIFAMLSDEGSKSDSATKSPTRKRLTPTAEDKRLHIALSRWLDNRPAEPKAREMAEALLRYLSSFDEVGGVTDVAQQKG